MYEQIDLDFSPDQISDIRDELTKAENAELRLYEIIEELKSQNYFENLIKHAFYITGSSALLIIFGLVISQIISCVKNYKQNAQHFGHNENVGQRLDLIEQKIERLDNMMGKRHLAGLALRAARVSESREGTERAGRSWKPQIPPRQDRRASLGDVVEAMNTPSPFLKAQLHYMQTPDLATPDGLPTRLSLRNLEVNNFSYTKNKNKFIELSYKKPKSIFRLKWSLVGTGNREGIVYYYCIHLIDIFLIKTTNIQKLLCV